MDTNDFDRLPDEALIRLHTLKSWGLIPFSTSTLWRKCKTREFPAKVTVSANVTAWRAGDIKQWLKDPSGYRGREEQQ